MRRHGRARAALERVLVARQLAGGVDELQTGWSSNHPANPCQRRAVGRGARRHARAQLEVLAGGGRERPWVDRSVAATSRNARRQAVATPATARSARRCAARDGRHRSRARRRGRSSPARRPPRARVPRRCAGRVARTGCVGPRGSASWRARRSRKAGAGRPECAGDADQIAGLRAVPPDQRRLGRAAQPTTVNDTVSMARG